MKRTTIAFGLLFTALYAFAQEAPEPGSDDRSPESGGFVIASEPAAPDGTAFGFWISARTAYDADVPNPAFGRVEGGGVFFLGDFTAFADLELSSDGRYATTAMEGYLGGIWSRITRGGFAWDSGWFSAKAGRFPHFDEVNSPYSLFVNSSGLPADLLDFRLDDGRFFFQSRWISLSLRSEEYPDRGAVYKVLGTRVGAFTFGIQDAAVFVRPGSGFDLAYFLVPWSGFMIQHIDSTPGAPWYRDQNDNGILGLFCEYDGDPFSAYAQVLVDDINLNRWFNPGGHMNPDKIALALGGRWDSPVGRFGFHAGGATKYTFESYGNSTTDEKYGYCYTYDSSYTVSGETMPLFPEDNNVGFLYGENALAFRLEYTRELPWFSLDASMEYVVNGERSPANPWHDEVSAPDDTAFLNDALLEHRIFTTIHLSRDFGSFALFAGLRAGWHVNPSGLRASGDESDFPAQILTPIAGGRPIFALSFGVKSSVSFPGPSTPRR
ncbi:MAG: hypothetical protein NT080_08350 [Spirochaetes bacterium]|nr:hypothetical protein [Spirochaetota bacterium]